MRNGKWLVWVLCWSLLGGSGLWPAAARAAVAQDQVEDMYPPEDPERMEQAGEAYDREDALEDAQAEGEAQAASQAGDAGDQGEFRATRQQSARPQAPGRGYVWVKPYRLPNGMWIAGHWRRRAMGGFAWKNGYWDATLKVYIPGFWAPVNMNKPGHVWVPGYWAGGRWVPGLWRPAQRQGFTWVQGHWSRQGEWIPGHWQPTRRPPAGKVWVRGFYNPRGVWVPGHWRVFGRKGYVWVKGRYNGRGVWMPGHWRNTMQARPGKPALLRPVPPKPAPHKQIKPKNKRGRGQGRR